MPRRKGSRAGARPGPQRSYSRVDRVGRAVAEVVADDAALAALGEHRVRFQAAIARDLRLRRTPELAFSVDPAIEKGTRVEEILRELHSDQDGDATQHG